MESRNGPTLKLQIIFSLRCDWVSFIFMIYSQRKPLLKIDMPLRVVISTIHLIKALFLLYSKLTLSMDLRRSFGHIKVGMRQSQFISIEIWIVLIIYFTY